MSRQGALWENEHGVRIGAIEAGTGSITRQTHGSATRFTFKKPFVRVPHVQITPELPPNPNAQVQQFWVYLMGDNGGPSVDKEGFTVGVFAKPGHTVTFKYCATSIIEGTANPKSKL